MKNPLLSIVTISQVLPIYKLNRDEQSNVVNSQLPANNIVLYKFEENEYEVVGQKYLYSIGEKVILIHPDSNLVGSNSELVFEDYIKPDGDTKKSKLGKNNRVRAISFNFAKTNELSDTSKLYSNGILIPTSLLMDLKLSDDILPDMTMNMWNELLPKLPELLGVTKIEEEEKSKDNKNKQGQINSNRSFPSFLIKSDESNFKNATKGEIINMLENEIVATFKSDGSSIKLFYLQHPNNKIHTAFINVFRKTNSIPFNIEEEMEKELGYEPIYDELDNNIMYKQLDDKHSDRISNYFGICSRNHELNMFGSNNSNFIGSYNVITKDVVDDEGKTKTIQDKHNVNHGLVYKLNPKVIEKILSDERLVDTEDKTKSLTDIDTFLNNLVIHKPVMELIDKYVSNCKNNNTLVKFEDVLTYISLNLIENTKRLEELNVLLSSLEQDESKLTEIIKYKTEINQLTKLSLQIVALGDYFNDYTHKFEILSILDEYNLFDKQFSLSNNEWVIAGYSSLNKLVDYCINTNQSLALGGELCGQGMKGSGNKHNPHSTKPRNIEFYQLDRINNVNGYYQSEVLTMTDFFNLTDTLKLDTVELMFKEKFNTIEELHQRCKEEFTKQVFEGLVLRNMNDTKYSFKYMHEEYDSKK